ncbi:MAG: hypothetical protein U0531_00830 [Dehalococcoidia bacterium]
MTRVTATATAFTLLDPGRVRVEATLDESSVARVKAGQEATMSSPWMLIGRRRPCGS